MDTFPECSGFGVARERSWFIEKYLRTSLRDDATIDVVPSECETSANPWEKYCPFQPIDFPTKWVSSAGLEIIVPATTSILRMNPHGERRKRPRTDDIIERHPEIANGWTKPSLHEMEGLLTGTPVILDGSLRVLPALPTDMNVRMLAMTVWKLWAKAEQHMKSGRIPLLKETTKDRIVALSERFGKLPDRRQMWTPRLAEAMGDEDAFLLESGHRHRRRRSIEADERDRLS